MSDAAPDSARRIFGIETEVGIAVTADPGLNIGPEEAARAMFRPVVSWGRSSNVFLANGSRLYLDVGSHPEYATAECDSILQLLAQDRAGDRILQGMAEQAELDLTTEAASVAIHLLKNNLDSAGNSFGCHENYLARREIPLQKYTDNLIPLFVSRTLITGAGGIYTDKTGSRFVLSPRAFHVWESVSSSTTRSRPMINSRDEPHADPHKYRRLHVIVGDSSRAEPTIALKIGITDLVLRMIEAHVNLGDVRLEKPVEALRTVAQDLTGKEPLRLASGRETTALKLQELFYEKARDFVTAHGASSEDTLVLDLWERSLRALAEERLELVETELDWVIKKQFLERYRERLNAGWADARLARLDLAYHDLSPERGIFEKFEATGAVRRLTREADVYKALVSPPQTTRAKLRGDFVRRAHGAGLEYSVDWVHLRLNSPSTRTLACRDPFAASDDRLESLFA